MGPNVISGSHPKVNEAGIYSPVYIYVLPYSPRAWLVSGCYVIAVSSDQAVSWHLIVLILHLSIIWHGKLALDFIPITFIKVLAR